MKLQKLNTDDVPAMWRINEEGLPGVGQVSEDAMGDLLSLATLPVGAFDEDVLVGFVLCLIPGTRYASPNYAWFNEHYEQFLYVDRIAVSTAYRDRQVGSRLYSRVFEHAQQHQWPVAAEVNLDPPNPGSMRFHERNGFTEVGTLQHDEKTVAMILRELK